VDPTCEMPVLLVHCSLCFSSSVVSSSFFPFSILCCNGYRASLDLTALLRGQGWLC